MECKFKTAFTTCKQSEVMRQVEAAVAFVLARPMRNAEANTTTQASIIFWLVVL